ncbi:aldo/keto reductase [Corallococcus sp. bb12-1]|uniref:aldo/keto reductase n=1 Tax=Corallococcus sp. bb12-1 TaxID=2996784 RepID=UPI00226E57BA|nr:aldo/keto reductase [Corallococcus sp. bb12-1]MCY1042644.1 aldo/keto reductase [Corallococcus sp. bb12-1]
MMQRPLGNSGLTVSALGFGAGPVGSEALSDSDAGALLHGVLDAGITLIDTAPSYGASEERIGRHLASRRREFVLSTKCGYGVPGVEDWTPECITRGVDLALQRLRTDVLDVLHFHSCPPDVLHRPGLLDALTRAVQAGKVRAAAYSGDNAGLDAALETGVFAVVQTSVNLFDQRSLDHGVAKAVSRGVGVIAKRPLANAPWRFADDRPASHDVGEYWDRMRRMNLQTDGLSWPELALRFTAFAPGVATCIVGTTQLENLRANARTLEKGELPEPLVHAIRDAFRRNDHGWDGVI